jgi:hypothetical protein
MADKSLVLIKVKAIMAAGTASGPLAKYLDIKQILLDSKIGYHDTINVSNMLVHPANRGGLMINHHNAHKTGFKIHKLGADLTQLEQACCIEMHPIGPARDHEVALNKGLVEKSAGMLAEVSGSERFISLGNSHCAAFCKAANARCITNIPEIADAAGRIDLNLLTNSNANYSKMLNIGWSWFVVPYWLADEVPGFPHLAQQALNASHTVANHATEMEVAASIAEVIAKQGLAICWKSAIHEAASSQPPCLDYIDTVAQYVKLYGGGSKAQLVHFLAGFAKLYGESLKLGQEFMKAITELQMPSQKSAFIHLRTAVLATQLTTTKVVDGIASLIKKADVNSFRGKTLQPLCEQVETMLDTAWNELGGMLTAGTATEIQTHRLYGMLCIRFVLFLTKKAKWGIDTKEYKSLEAIFAVYTDDKDKVVKNLSSSSSAGTASTASSSGDAPAATIGDASNPLWLAMQQLSMPLVVGNTYQNNKEHPNKVFHLTKIDITGASFLEHIVLKPTVNAVDCKLEDLKKWSVYKGKLQKLVDNSLFSTCNSQMVQLELDKCLVFTELCKLAADHEVGPDDLIFTMNPMELAAGRAFKKGELKLVPMTDSVNKLMNSQSRLAMQINVRTNVVWLTAPTPPKDELTKSTTAIVAPFWLVKTTSEPEAGNMTDCKLKAAHGEISFQIFTNCKALKKFDKLLLKIDGAVQPLKKQKLSV